MEIKGKKALVLGAGGMVGQSICRYLIREGVETLILASLHEHEVESLSKSLSKEFSHLPTIKKTWGDYLVRHEWKDLSREELMNDPKKRRAWIVDVIAPLTREVLNNSEIYHLCNSFKPDVIIDSVNLATAISYQDIFAASKETFNAIKNGEEEKKLDEETVKTIEKLLLTQYTPQITRHVQLFFQSMVEAKTEIYLKIGTSGSGGMGLNIPFTHSEDKPSQTLLAKSAVAGAHSLLLFLMARTPGGPIIKEIKPTAAIAWKQIGFGPITRRGRAILLEDVHPGDAVHLVGHLKKTLPKKVKNLKHNGEPKALTAPFIDLGENGLLALGEFEVLTDVGQMEFITPEEIAQTAIWEIKGRNTGSEVVAAMDNSTMGPTFRAGYIREQAIQRAHEIAKNNDCDSIAFELLGPPRISKILYEAYLLKKAYGTLETVLGIEAKEISQKLESFILDKQELRSQIISIGIPILLPKGNRLLRGSKIAIPADVPGQPSAHFEITDANINHWAHDGWVDLRETNIIKWQDRFQKILDQIKSIRPEDTSSSHPKSHQYWKHHEGNTTIEIAQLSSWILTEEEQAFRMKA